MNARRPRPHALQALRIPLAALALALTLGLTLFAGCGLSTGGIPEEQDGGTACTTASQCDDNDLCTTDTCSLEGLCVHTPLPDGPAPAVDQTVGDCQSVMCTGGVESSVADNTNAPTSTNACVNASCVAGVPTMGPVQNGTSCMINGNSGACTSGTCQVVCTMASQCISTNPCQIGSCNGATGLCQYANVTDGTPTPGYTQIKGDCHDQECVGGTSTPVVDDSDIPAKMGDCQDPICTNGTPSQSPHAEDSSCSTYMTNMSGFCDGMGNCVQCTKGNECPGTTDDCEQPACSATFVCGTTYTAVNTPTTTNPVQVAGDCLTIVCNGTGGTTTIPDDADLPNTGTPCLTGVCNNGVIGTPTINAGVMCGGSVSMPEKCSSTGMCGCVSNTDCTAPNTCGGGNPGTPLYCGCTKTTCAAKDVTCGTTSDGCFATLNCDDNTKDGTETDVDCGGVDATNSTCALTCAQGKKCLVGTDCTSGFCADGVCCNSACDTTCEACTAAKKGSGADGVCGAIKSGTDPDSQCAVASMASCGNSGGCNGAGACSQWSSTTVCVQPSCSGTVLTYEDLCNGAGTCVPPGTLTHDCSPYKCTGTPAACTTTCAADTDCASSSYYCNLTPSPHTCVLKLVLGTACSAADQCQSGFCADGVCCNTACTGTACQACSAALTGGTNGTCGNATNGTNPHGSCATTAQTSCNTDGKCNNGACEDWSATTVCVNPSCASNQETPQVTCTGSGGPCPTYTKTSCNPYICGTTACLTGCGTSDSNCINGYYCDGVGAGTCKPKGGAGVACANSDQCSNGATCGGGFCCLTACPDQGANSCGTNGMCAATSGVCMQYPLGTSCNTGTVDCTGGPTGGTTQPDQCDGNGNCNQGMMAGACAGNASCGAGMTCNGPACGTMDPNCATGYYCDGVGAGTCQTQLATGTACTRDPECVSGDYCTSMGSDAGTGCQAQLPSGSSCTRNPECSSNMCNMGMMTCM